MYYIGVDLGGTNIKAAIVDGDCAILGEGSLPTALPRSADEVCADIAAAVRTALDEAGLTLGQMDGLGVGCPGTVNPQTGVVEYSNNLGWRGYPLRARLAGHLGLNAAMGNDANVAALGEYCAGSARGTKSAVVVTLGTGVASAMLELVVMMMSYPACASARVFGSYSLDCVASTTLTSIFGCSFW